MPRLIELRARYVIPDELGYVEPKDIELGRRETIEATIDEDALVSVKSTETEISQEEADDLLGH